MSRHNSEQDREVKKKKRNGKKLNPGRTRQWGATHLQIVLLAVKQWYSKLNQ